MQIRELKPRQALNKAFLKVKPSRNQIEVFKTNLVALLEATNTTESEEFHKNLVIDFLKKTYYDPNHYINTKGRNDLVIHNGNTAQSPVGVIIEAKKPTNKSEMLTTKKVNVKAFQELVLYYLRERISQKNVEIKYLIASNINEWFIFDATLFERLFAQSRILVKQFDDFENGRLADTKTEFFYKQIVEPFIATVSSEIEFTYLNIQDYRKVLQNTDKADDNSLIVLFKLLSPEHLLKLPFANDSNSLDRRFYTELLHIIGLTETKDGGKKLIQRNGEGARNTGTLIEDTIIQLDSLDKLGRIEKLSQFGSTTQDRLFNVALELSITWINRILFLKLLEAQLITYHKGDISYSFLNFDRIKTYDDLNILFFQVLARQHAARNEDVKDKFRKVPYLNSSLFEPTELEQVTLFISNLKDDKTIPIIPSTVLKDQRGKKRVGKLKTLEYLFEFLNAYDFSNEGSEEIQEDNKTLINASVLGLIFEKINGYKDGSFFTPGFVTMYICRETIRAAVIQKFNEIKNWSCERIEDIYDKIEDRKEANRIINDIKICDPAVGSGHFLVSALNEIIAVKNDLKILQDFDGKRLKEYQVEVINDDLIITDEDGELFEYTPGNNESQRVQKALFHEKQTIIERCLFGVDINSNSAKICRLRLWIELLKNTYYKNETELETLPNIDINIKCGNSLVSRFPIDSDLKKALKKKQWSVESYRSAVDTYRNAENKEQKREMERLIGDIKSDFRSEISLDDPKLKRLKKLSDEYYQLLNQHQLFEETKKDLADRKKKERKLCEEIKKLELEIEEIRSNKVFDNAFEWRFEFPEVIGEDGRFLGFDVVIGNPPYVFGGNEGISEGEKKYYKENFVNGSGKINLFTLFIEKAFDILRKDSQFGYIIPNTFLRVTSYDSTRRYLVNNFKVNSVYDFGDKVFDDAVTTAIVVTATKAKVENFEVTLIGGANSEFLSKSDIIENNFVIATGLNTSSQKIVKKLKTHKLLGSVCEEMIFGVVITKNKNEVVSPFPREGWKPYLEGREIGPYSIGEVKQWLNYDKKLLHRSRTPEVFEAAEKIMIQRITGGSHPLKAAYDNQGLYNKESINNIILKSDSPVQTKYVLALLNSKLVNWFYTMQFTNESSLTVNLSKTYLAQIPLALPEKEKEREIITIVDNILRIKKLDSSSDTSLLERKIDELIYDVYSLTPDEVTIIEGSGRVLFEGDATSLS